MAKSLVVVESPSKAKTIAKYLGKGFDVKASVGHVKDLPKSRMGVDIEGGFEPEYETIKTGQAEVRATFKSGKTTVIAGCMVTEGKIVRNAQVKLLRAGKEIFSGKLDSLKRFKDDAKEVATGYECGIALEKFNDLQDGDIIESYMTQEKPR